MFCEISVAHGKPSVTDQSYGCNAESLTMTLTNVVTNSPQRARWY